MIENPEFSEENIDEDNLDQPTVHLPQMLLNGTGTLVPVKTKNIKEVTDQYRLMVLDSMNSQPSESESNNSPS